MCTTVHLLLDTTVLFQTTIHTIIIREISFSFVHAALVQNDISTVSIRMEHSSGGYYGQNQSSNSVIIVLEPGDQVWLQTYSGSLKGYPSPSTTFSGFLISE